MIDTSKAAPVAAPFPKFPPGPPSDLRSRIEAVRAITQPGELFSVFVQTDTAPVIALWSFPDAPLTTGRTFWGNGCKPHVIRLKSDNPPHIGPLVYIVRQGREIEDYKALAALVERDGPKYDAPVHQIMEWMPGDLGRGQFVAFLPLESEAHNG